MKNYFNSNIKEEIKRVNPDTLVNHGYAQSADVSGIVCPHCGNGSGEDGTGIEFKQDANGFYRAHCFKCGENFDNLRVIADHFGYNLSASFDFKHHHKASAKNFNAKQNYQQNNKAQETQEQPPVDHSQLIQVAKNNLINLPFATYRGLMAETLVHFGWGFGAGWHHPDSPNMPPTDRIIIPTSNYHYLARAIDDSVPERYRKIHVGKKEIFNAVDLQLFRTVVVVEGELDCASIWQVTDGLLPVVAVSGCANYKMLLQWLDNNPDCNCSFIVMFDNDSKEGNAGQTNAKKFVAKLIQRGFPAVNKILSDKQDFDANDWLQENPDALRDRLFDIYDEGSEELEKISDDIQKEKDFQEKVSAFENANGKIPTGFLDEIKSAAEKLSGLTEKNFDANLLNDELFKRQLGLCSFYSFASQKEKICTRQN